MDRDVSERHCCTIDVLVAVDAGPQGWLVAVQEGTLSVSQGIPSAAATDATYLRDEALHA